MQVENHDLLDALEVRKQLFEYVQKLEFEGKKVSFQELGKQIGISWRQLERYCRAQRFNELSPLPNEENRKRLQSFFDGKRYLSVEEQLDEVIRRLDITDRKLNRILTLLESS